MEGDGFTSGAHGVADGCAHEGFRGASHECDRANNEWDGFVCDCGNECKYSNRVGVSVIMHECMHDNAYSCMSCACIHLVSVTVLYIRFCHGQSIDRDRSDSIAARPVVYGTV